MIAHLLTVAAKYLFKTGLMAESGLFIISTLSSILVRGTLRNIFSNDLSLFVSTNTFKDFKLKLFEKKLKEGKTHKSFTTEASVG